MDDELRRLERRNENDLKYPSALFRAGRYAEAAGPLADYLEMGSVDDVLPFLPKLAQSAEPFPFVEGDSLVYRPAVDVCWEYSARTPAYRILLIDEGLFSFDILALQWFDLRRFGVRNIPEPERRGWWYLPIWESRQQSDLTNKLYVQAALEKVKRRAA